MLLYVIRHGDPTYSPDALTPLGHRQAEAVGKRLAAHGLDRIYSSPLIRAQQTAQPAAELLKLPVQIEEWTSEAYTWRDFTMDFPDGRKHWVYNKQNTLFLTEENRNRNLDWEKCDVFEGRDFKTPYKRIQECSDEFLARQGYERVGSVYKVVRPNNDRVALFCHEGFSMVWFPFLLSIPPHIFWAGFSFTHTGVTIFQFNNTDDGWTAPTVLAMNDISHLHAEHLPTKYCNRFYY